MKRKYPLSEIFDISAFSSDRLNIDPSSLDTFLQGIKFSTHETNKLIHTNAIFGRLIIYGEDDISFTVPGLDIELVLNPIFNGSQNIVSGINVNYYFNWPILKYATNFKLNSFGESAEQFFDFIKELVGIRDDDFFDSFLEVQYPDSTNKVQDFVDDYNVVFPNASITLLNSTDEFEVFDNVIDQIFDNHGEFLPVILTNFILNAPSESLQKIFDIFSFYIGEVEKSDFKGLLEPYLKVVTENVSLGVKFPTAILKKVDTETGMAELDQNNDFVPVILNINLGNLIFESTGGVSFNNVVYVDFPKSLLGNTGFTLEVFGLKIDLNKDRNIAEADAYGYPTSFVGCYVTDATIGFPASWQHNPNSTGEIRGRNLLIGTGGISGTLALEAKTSGTPSPLLELKFGTSFAVSLDAFSVTFQQNSIINSNIRGTLTIPGFKQGLNEAKVPIDATIEKDGDFKISALLGEVFDPISIPNILDLYIIALEVGSQNGKYYATITGEVNFTVNVPNITTDFPQRLPVKVKVWENGKIEFDKSVLILPRAISLKVGPVALAVTALHFGSAELKHDGILRQYNYIGFDGALNLNPGGVGVRGNGVKLYYTTDDGPGKDSHRFIRVDGIGIDLMIPGDAVSPDQAELFLKGYLAVKNKPQGESGPATTEYAGSIAFSINRAAVKGAGAMRYAPAVPSFLVDISAELSSPIVLGSSGLGLYGFRGLMANNYRLNKPEEDTWWKFYKKPQEGINFEKYTQDKGFSLGLGTILATVPDGGTSFSSKLLLLLGLPDVFLLSGQGNVMSKRVSYLDPDPPYSVMMSISRESIEAGFGVNYLVPKGSGAIMKTTGDIQMAYFFKNASAWYINVGKDFPEQERLRSVTFSLFESYAYLMISAQGIKFGEGKKFEFKKNYGPVGMNASLYRNTFARLSFKPVQLGGGMDVGGNAGFSVLKFKLALSIIACLGADAFKPFKISGGAKVALQLPRPFKNREVDVNFVWVFDETKPTAPFKPIEAIDGKTPVKAINMLTGEDYTVNYTQAALPNNISWIDKTIPLDSFIDVDFEYSVKTELTQDSAIIQGEVVSPDYTPSIPPERGLSEPVKHELKLKKVLIKAWNGSSWADYNVYEGASAIKNIPDVQTELSLNPDYLKTFPQGFWQLKSKNKNTSLRILGQNMFSYLNSAAEGSMKLEYLGFKGGAVLCEEDKIQPTCINWEDVATDTEYAADTIINYKGVTLKVISAEGLVKTYSGYNLTKGLNFTAAEGVEIYFNEPQGYVKPSVTIFSPNKLQVEYYKEVVEGYNANNVPVYIYSKIRTDIVEASDLALYTGYDDADVPVKKIKIAIDRIEQQNINANHTADLTIGHASYTSSLMYNSAFNGQIDNVTIIGRGLTEAETANLKNNDATGPNLIGQWLLDGNADDSSPNNLHGSLVANAGKNPIPAPGKSGVPSTSYMLTGATSGIYQNNHIKVNHDSKLSVGRENFTISAWIKMPNYDITQKGPFNTHSFILSKTNGSYGGYELICGRSDYNKFYHESIYFNYSEDSYSVGHFSIFNMISFPYKGNNKIYDGNWHFVAVTVDYDKLECVLYFDDVKSVKSISTPPGQPQNNNAYLHQLCLLSEKESLYNAAIPPQSRLTAENAKMADGLTKLLQPVWRPDTNYAIEITTGDNVNSTGEVENTVVIGFKTAGPVGYFHNQDSRYTSLAGDEKDKYQLATLQHYINYNRSYPNAEGKLLGSKPIFYKQPALRLYFNEAYANVMYSEWGAYNGLPTTEYDLELYVADPLNEQTGTNALQATWVQGKNFSETEDIRMLNNLIVNGQNCSGLIGPIERQAYNAKYVLPDLKPSTLYTALYHAVHDTEKVKVHQHVFATSKYGTFKEQIESYELDGNLTAIFSKAINFSAADITKATDIVIKNGAQDKELVKEFADDFDRLLYGALHNLSPMNAPTGTEFNRVINSNNQKTIGVLIRNPEPIFNPQLPDSDLLASISVINNLQIGGSDTDYQIIFSKDRSAVFITKNPMDIPNGILDITMKNLEYNGSGYVLKSPQVENEVTVNITLS